VELAERWLIVRDWRFPELSEAEKFLERKVREKTNPEGKRERKYRVE